MYGDETRSKTILFTALFAALITAGGWISLPVFAIPFTLQSLFVILAAAVMQKKAVYPLLLYVAAGLFGLPVFHNGLSGIGVLLGPTGGYLLGFICAAFFAGLLFSRKKDITAALSAVIIYDAAAVLWFMLTASASFPAAVTACVLPYLAGDIVKAVAAVFAVNRLRRLHD
ncbi:MAG: biotin transporter BioY [Methanocorpusculum parvum]|nr:biotin transporter BioY [Methanocorpusculum parvum]